MKFVQFVNDPPSPRIVLTFRGTVWFIVPLLSTRSVSFGLEGFVTSRAARLAEGILVGVRGRRIGKRNGHHGLQYSWVSSAEILKTID